MGDTLPASHAEAPGPSADFSESWGAREDVKPEAAPSWPRRLAAMGAATVRFCSTLGGELVPGPGASLTPPWWGRCQACGGRGGLWSSHAQLMPKHRDLPAVVLWPVPEDSPWPQACEGTGRVHGRSVAAKGCPARLLGSTVIYFPV